MKTMRPHHSVNECQVLQSTKAACSWLTNRGLNSQMLTYTMKATSLADTPGYIKGPYQECREERADRHRGVTVSTEGRAIGAATVFSLTSSVNEECIDFLFPYELYEFISLGKSAAAVLDTDTSVLLVLDSPIVLVLCSSKEHFSRKME